MAPTADSHVAVVAFPFGTHASPLLAIIRRLAAASPETIFSFFNTCQSNNTIFSTSVVASSPNVKPYNVWDGVHEGYTFSGKPQEHIELFMKAAPQSLHRNMDMAVAETGKEVTCLVTDAFIWFAAEMAQEMGVPWVPLWAPGPCPLLAHLYTDLIRHRVSIAGDHPAPGSGNERLSFIPGMSKILVQDLPDGIVFGNLESFFSTMLHQTSLMLPQATAVFINSFEELDKTVTGELKSKFHKFLSVGPFNLASPPPPAQDDSGCLPWLDKQEPASVAYISFGSVAIPPKEELVAIAEALEGSGIPFIWSLRENVRPNLPKAFLDKTEKRGKVVPWAPQADILYHRAIGVFVTHCGWNSLLESMVGGVPMICRPFFGDHKLNGRMIEDVWEIGIKLEGGVFTKGGMERCLAMVLSQEKGKRIRAKIKLLKDLATEAVGPTGSSTGNFKLLLDVITRPRGFQK
ncbi:UDP-glucuronosyl/UDP-glucosyltransferase [Trema orientale]|uniref:Glycosyltransferase n=1 Tax=Trema orientale TaxID=63057 RepID=A0A2P5CN09_TREOI|nr:UDP-glucuronosyl/UDP-glucosyltransferase [Trema orientale]